MLGSLCDILHDYDAPQIYTSFEQSSSKQDELLLVRPSKQGFKERTQARN